MNPQNIVKSIGLSTEKRQKKKKCGYHHEKRIFIESKNRSSSDKMYLLYGVFP